jgi:hypothetical protein
MAANYVDVSEKDTDATINATLTAGSAVGTQDVRVVWDHETPYDRIHDGIKRAAEYFAQYRPPDAT